MFKKTKLIAGITLLVQSVTCVALFFVYLGKKKKTANTFLGVGIISAIIGAFLLIWEREEENLSLFGEDDWENDDDFFDDYADDVDCIITDDADSIEAIEE